ncbi:MAG: glycoside hydrolase family 16 protein [Jatrophihabitantaceae bacterium]
MDATSGTDGEGVHMRGATSNLGRHKSSGRRRFGRLVAAAAVLGSCLVVPTAAGAATQGSGCDLLRALLGVCSPAQGTGNPGPAPTCGDEAPLKPDGTPWTCTFDDEFDGTALNRGAWTVQQTSAYGYHSGAECFVDDPDNVSVGDGQLDLTVRKLDAPFTCASPAGSYQTQYTSGSVYTSAFAQEYGRFEIRARFAESGDQPGLQGSLWLFPASRSSSGPLSGPSEIDVAEAYSRHGDLVSPTVHSLTTPLSSTYCTVPDYGAALHTYTVTWTAKTITFDYDGRTCFRTGTPFSLPSGLRPANPFLVSLTQALGIGNNRNTAATPLPATLQVDYVRVWK